MDPNQGLPMEQSCYSKYSKEVMARNIQYYLHLSGVSRKELCRELGISYSTFSDWYHARSYPRIDKIEMLTGYFGIAKSDLVEERENRRVPEEILTPKARELVQFLAENPEYEGLFDVVRQVKKENIDFIKEVITRIQ